MSAGSRSESSPRLSRRKRIAFRLLLLAGMYLFAELLSLACLSYFYGGWSGSQRVMDGVFVPDPLASGFEYPDEIVHPYFGWVRRPGSTNGAESLQPPVNAFGFTDSRSPIQVRRPGAVIVGILGGSVAQQFADEAGEALKAQLAARPEYAGQEVALVRLGLSGYKQPQQLLVVNYLLSIGAEFDILLNIDGYNEIVLPAVENAPNHVFDAYPRSWNLRVTEAGNLEAMRSIGRIALLKDLTKDRAATARSFPWRYSVTAHLLWRAYYGYIRRQIFDEYSKLHSMKYSDWDFAANGPPQNFADEQALLEHCAAVWMRSSLQLQQVCAANSIRYFHFLQPNQYVPGSKILGSAEKEVAYFAADRGKKPVEKGYPLLVREGARLAEAGVAFFDLTMLFADHSEATYRDPCCHLNDRGNELLVQAIVRAIASQPR